MKRDCVLGIDCSTTASKAIVWNKGGKILAEGRAEIPVLLARPEWAEQDAGKWWEATVEAVRTAARQVEARRIGAVGIAHQRETFVPLSGTMAPLRNGILWVDTRAASEVQTLKRMGAEWIHKRTGLFPNLYASNVKIMWLRENEPSLFGRVFKYLDVGAFLVWKLTGKLVTTWPSANPMGLLDMESLRWDEQIMSLLGVREDQFCELAAPGEIVGGITKETAVLLGLPEGIPVAGGGGDGQCAALGAGVVDEGRASLNLGTAVVSELYSRSYVTGHSFRTMCGCVPRTYVAESLIASGTFTLNWFLREFAEMERETSKARGVSVEQLFDSLASDISSGEARLLMLPYLKGASAPYWEPFARGVVIGWCESTTKAHFYRSILEGIAFEQKFLYEEMEKSLGRKIGEVVLLGGGAKSCLWRQIVADVVGIPVLIPPTFETTCLGAGMLAARAAGLYDSALEASKNMSSVQDSCSPIEKNREFYNKIYERVYKLLFPRIQELVAEFTKITSEKGSPGVI